MADVSDPIIVKAREIAVQVISGRYTEVRRADKFEKQVATDFSELSEYLVGKDARTFCILAVSFLEDTLQRNFARCWNISGKRVSDRYFGSNGPLSTFSQRTLVASGLGWLTPDMADEASALRRIRNAFAHDHRVHALSLPPLVDIVRGIRPHEEIWVEGGMESYIKGFENIDNETRLQLRVFCCAAWLTGQTLARSKLIQNDVPADWRGGGFAGLMELEQEIIDVCIGHCFGTVGVTCD